MTATPTLLEAAMRTLRLLLAITFLAVNGSAGAQTAAPAKSPAATKAPMTPAVRPALAELVAPRAPDLGGAGIQKIVARTGKNRRDIQVLSSWGPIYFPWPKGVTPAPFQLDVGAGNALTVRAEGYTEAKKAQYAAAFDAVLPQAIRMADEARARALRPKA